MRWNVSAIVWGEAAWFHNGLTFDTALFGNCISHNVHDVVCIRLLVLAYIVRKMIMRFDKVLPLRIYCMQLIDMVSFNLLKKKD